MDKLAIYKIKSPLSVYTSIAKTKKSKFTLNLNQYRNTHYQKLNKAKSAYHKEIWQQVKELPFFDKISLTFVVHMSHDNYDTDNICSVHSKFFCDVLVNGDLTYLRKTKRGKVIRRKFNKLEDDNKHYVIFSTNRPGSTNRDDPHVEIIIKEE